MTKSKSAAVLSSSPPTSQTAAFRALRLQIAFLRGLLDEIERVTLAAPREENVSEQVIEELARLGRLSLEAASELTRILARRCA